MKLIIIETILLTIFLIILSFSGCKDTHSIQVNNDTACISQCDYVSKLLNKTVDHIEGYTTDKYSSCLCCYDKECSAQEGRVLWG